MAKRVLVERLRPQTQQEVVVRPVDTFIQPAPVQKGNLQELAQFIDRIQPTVGRLTAEREKRLAEEDTLRARKLAETTAETYSELVNSGEIGPEESPVFRYAFNETRGQAKGYEFIQAASQAYSRGSIAEATDGSGFDEWFQSYYSGYVEENVDLLDRDGAYEAFSRTAKQSKNNLLQQHLGNVNKNFANAQTVAYENFVFGALDTADMSTPEGQQALRNSFNVKQGDLASSGGPAYSYSKLNNSTVDSVIAYYATNNYDTAGLEQALSTLSGGTGSLGGTSYARVEVAKARVTFAKERLASEKRDEEEFRINTTRTQDNVNQIFYGNFMGGNYDVDAIYEELSPELQAQIETYYPEGLGGLFTAADTFKSSRNSDPMAPAEVASIREELERTPSSQRVQRVIALTKQGKITDTPTYTKMMSFATSSRDGEGRGVNTDATKDPIYKDFFERQFTANTDKYTGDGARRLYYFQSSFYELFDSVNEEGVRTWDTYSAARKLQLLNGVMKEVNSALDEEQGALSLLDNSSNVVSPLLGTDGKALIINGNPQFQQNTLD